MVRRWIKKLRLLNVLASTAQDRCIERVHFILLGSCMSTILKEETRREKRVWCVSIGCFGYALRNLALLLLVLFWSCLCTLSI